MRRKAQGRVPAWRLSATEGVGLIRQGELGAPEWSASCLDRIEARDAEVMAWSSVVSRAELPRRSPVSSLPLAGVPVGVKDVIDTADFPTEFNSPLYAGHRPTRDADCVSILKAAGATILGKTDTVEFAAGGHKARTRNPHDLSRTPGGSSSGSAAAVADFHVPIALGTQSAGSIIRPASYCGVFAMKPTWGAIGRAGVKPYAPSLDTIGWLTRTVEDLQMLADVFDLPSDHSVDPTAPVAICKTPEWLLAEKSTANAIEHCADLLAKSGRRTIALDLPKPFDRLVEARRTIAAWEGHASFLAEHRLHGERLIASVAAMVRQGVQLSARTVRAAYDVAGECRIQFDRIAAEFAAVFAPSAASEAPNGLESTGGTEFNEMWTLLGVPVINFPLFQTAAGLPVGVSILGPRYADQHLLHWLSNLLNSDQYREIDKRTA